MHVVKGAIMANYRMTPKRRAALRKAQKISARKRRGKGKGKLAAANRRATRNKRIALATGGLFGAAMAAGYVKGKRSNSYKNKKGVKTGLSMHPRYSGMYKPNRRDLVKKKARMSSVLRNSGNAPGLAFHPRYGYGYKPNYRRKK